MKPELRPGPPRTHRGTIFRVQACVKSPRRTPANQAFEGLKPVEVIERGSIIRIYTIWYMERMNEGRAILQPVDPLWDTRKNDC